MKNEFLTVWLIKERGGGDAEEEEEVSGEKQPRR